MKKPFFAAVFFSVLLAAVVSVSAAASAEGLRPYSKEAFEHSRKTGKTVIVGVYADW